VEEIGRGRVRRRRNPRPPWASPLWDEARGGGRGTTGGGVGESKEKRFGVFVIDGIVGNFSKNSSHSR
jgi:hypothetical protein